MKTILMRDLKSGDVLANGKRVMFIVDASRRVGYETYQARLDNPNYGGLTMRYSWLVEWGNAEVEIK